MQSMLSEEIRVAFRQAPFIADLGIELLELSKGMCVTGLSLERRHLQQGGFVHAGVQATMADHTAGAAASTLVPRGQVVLTVEFKLNLLRPARGERLLCRARVLKPGRQLSVVESEVAILEGSEERLVSKMTATMSIVALPVAGDGPAGEKP